MRVTPGDEQNPFAGVLTEWLNQASCTHARMHNLESFWQLSTLYCKYIDTKHQVDADVIDYHGPQDSLAYRQRFLHLPKDDRGHQRTRVIAIDPATGTSRTIVDEKSDTFINQIKYYSHYSADGKVDLGQWTSGWNHLYTYDLKIGKETDNEADIVPHAITSGQWAVKKVVSLQEVEGIWSLVLWEHNLMKILSWTLLPSQFWWFRIDSTNHRRWHSQH